MSLKIKKSQCLSIAVLIMAAVILGWACGTTMAADKMMQKPVAGKDLATKPAEIHFVDITGVKNWRAEGVNSMLIEGVNGQWYRVTFFSECFPLPWTERVAFVTNPDGKLDRFSSILVGGQQCYFKDVTKIAPPEK